MRADSMRHTASTAALASLLLTAGSEPAGSELPGLLAPRAFLLDPFVVLRELVDAGDAADFRLGSSRHGSPLGPLDCFLLRCDIQDVVAAEKFLGLAVGTIGDYGSFAGEIDYDSLLRIVEAFSCQQDSGSDQFIVELAHGLEHFVEVGLLKVGVRLVGSAHDQHVLCHFNLLGLWEGRPSTFPPTGRTARELIDTCQEIHSVGATDTL